LVGVQVNIRPADDGEHRQIADLHALSWQSAYRGWFDDDYLDNEAVEDRRRTWAERFAHRSGSLTLVAYDGDALVGFAHALLDHDPLWGTQVDNLHVSPGSQRHSVGRHLLLGLASAVARDAKSSGLYLHVIEGNRAALRFYERLGGRRSGCSTVTEAGGQVTELSLAWTDLAHVGDAKDASIASLADASVGSQPVDVRCAVEADTGALVEVWTDAGLVRPWNDPVLDVERKLALGDGLLLVAVEGERIVGSVMVGYEGHRGWINYLAVTLDARGVGIGRRLMAEAELALWARGCPKINLQIRDDNTQIRAFYEAIGYSVDEAVSMGKRLIPDD